MYTGIQHAHAGHSEPDAVAFVIQFHAEYLDTTRTSLNVIVAAAVHSRKQETTRGYSVGELVVYQKITR